MEDPSPADPSVTTFDIADDPRAEAGRLRTAHRYDQLQGLDGDSYSHVAELAACVLDTPYAFVTFVHEQEQRMEACVGLDLESVDLDNSYCVHTIQSPGVLVVEDGQRDERFADMPIVQEDGEHPALRFYAGAPLEMPDGFRIGTLCVLDTKPRPRPDETKLRHLERMARMVVDELELRRETRRRKQHEQDLRQASQRAEVARAVARQAQAEAEEALKEAEEAGASRSRFLAGVAHDLRSPLSVINGLAELLAGSLQDPEAGHADKIYRAAQQLSTMAESLSDLARLDRSKSGLSTEEVDLSRVVRDATEPLRPRAARSDIDLQIRPPDESVVASVNPPAVRRVVDNLVGNAIKYCRSGDRVTVRIEGPAEREMDRGRTGNGEEGGDGFPRAGWIVVEDTGPGIDPAFLPRIFEPFARDSMETEGTGLGLAVARELVTSMDGHIDVESEPGEGTTFRVGLPSPQSDDRTAPIETATKDTKSRRRTDEGASAGASATLSAPHTLLADPANTGERRLRRLVRRLPGAVYRCTYDTEWVSLYMGSAFQDICGIDPDALDPAGRSFRDVVVDEDVDRIRNEVRRAVDNRSYYSVEYRIQGDNGRVRWVEDNGRPVFEDDGSVRWLDGILIDISNRKEAEEALRRMNETLEDQVRERTRQVRRLSAELAMAEQRERDQIARVIHDDLQQFLYAVQVEAKRLVDGVERHPEVNAGELPVDPEKVADLLQQAIETTRGLTIDLAPPVLDGDGLIEALQWLRSHMADRHDVTVALRGDETDRAIPKELRMVLFQSVRELVRNVHEHAETDRARVEVVDDGDGLILHVVDDGIGFDSRGVLEKETTGFGLQNVQERLRFFGASLEIDSTPHDGTRCTIRLPSQALSDLEDVDPIEPENVWEPV